MRRLRLVTILLFVSLAVDDAFNWKFICRVSLNLPLRVLVVFRTWSFPSMFCSVATATWRGTRVIGQQCDVSNVTSCRFYGSDFLEGLCCVALPVVYVVHVTVQAAKATETASLACGRRYVPTMLAVLDS